MTSPIPQRVLVYDRISQNRIKTALLVTVAILSLIPFLGMLGWGTYATIGHFAVRTQPFASDNQDPYARMQEYAAKLAAAPPAKLRALRLEHQRLAAAQGKLLHEMGSGQITWSELPQETDRLTREAVRLQTETERLIDPEGVKRMEDRERSEAATRIWLSVAVAFFLVAALTVVAWGLMKSPGTKALAFCGARPAGQSSDEVEAKRLIENLAIGAGLPPPKLYVIESTAPNAFASGMDPEHSTVAVTTGLLRLLDRRELEGVLAHELAHIGNRDTRLSTVVFAITFYMRLPSLLWKSARPDREAMAMGMRSLRYGLGFERILLRLAGSPVFIYIFIITPFLAMLIRAAISRGREALADADAALLTRNPEGLLRALAKIAGAGSMVGGSSPIVSHLYFADPSAASVHTGLFTGNLLSSHPPIEERIAKLREFGAAVSSSVIEEAMKVGETYGLDNLSVAQLLAPTKAPDDELTALGNADTRSRVFRLVGAAPVALYERDDPRSAILAELAPGTLVVSFEYSSKMRQVLTPSQTFGYLPRAAKLVKVAMIPEEVFQSASAPQAAQAAAAGSGTASVQPLSASVAKPAPTAPAASATLAAPGAPANLFFRAPRPAQQAAPQAAPEPQPAATAQPATVEPPIASLNLLLKALPPAAMLAALAPPPAPTHVETSAAGGPAPAVVAAPEVQRESAAPAAEAPAAAATAPPVVPEPVQATTAATAPLPAPTQAVATQPIEPIGTPGQPTSAIPGFDPGLTGLQTVGWAFAGLLAVGSVLMGVYLALKALAGR